MRTLELLEGDRYIRHFKVYCTEPDCGAERRGALVDDDVEIRGMWLEVRP